MSKHDESQAQVEALKVGDEISTPGVTGVVLAKGPVLPSEPGQYAGAVLLTTVKGNDFHPFRIATWYFQDDGDTNQGWQSFGGVNFPELELAVARFKERSAGMTRYLILEVVEGQTHDLTDLVETMRDGDKAVVKAAGLVLDVKIPTRALVKRWVTTNGPERRLYVEEG